ncbi:MAG: hypothetical protein N2745_05665 [Syntrophorhabdaceae bacterium]|nr:hypothetical protein [Syntrophorhabdaceae bacterium]
MLREEEIKNTIQNINPKLDELAEGIVEFIGFDSERRVLTVKLIGGKLH